MGDRSSHRGDRHPSHLRGRDIGMFYRNRHNKTKQQDETSKSHIQLGPSVSLSDQKIEEIRDFINLPVSSSHSNLNHETLNNLIHDESIESEFKNKFLKINTINFEQQLAENMSNIYLKNEESNSNQEDREITFEEAKREDYEKMMEYRKTLPSYNHQQEIIKLVESNQVILISGDTGCGKTTQVSQYLLDHYIKSGKGSKCRILCTQPRRISAITIAERVAEERLEPLGASVGYQIRLNSVLPRGKNGTILYCTAGILLKLMESDKALSSVSHLILDEIHERDIVSDLSIGIIKKILAYRQDLKVILMSATLQAEMFSRYYANCPIISIEGRTYPVTEFYLEDVLEEIKFDRFASPTAKQDRLPIWVRKKNSKKFKTENDRLQSIIEPYARSLRGKYSDWVIKTIMNPETENINIDLIEALIFNICQNKPAGSILVFLPGYDKISKLHKQMQDSNRYPNTRYMIFALHSMMPSVDQKQVFYPAPEGKRKIIIATNIAETSITINDVVYVIDSGKRKLTSFDTENNIQTLQEQWVSVANSSQRKGRAGRVQPGVCYHLYTKGRLKLLDEYPVPEILCTRLENTILTIKILCLGNTSKFLSTLIDVPDTAVTESSIKLLKRLNALDEHEHLTPLGLHLAQLPLDPQIGKMILLGAIFSCVDPITTVAASLSFKDPFYKPLGKQEQVDRIRCSFAKNTRSDHLTVVNVFKQWRIASSERHEKDFCYDNFLSISILNQLTQMKKQFCDYLSSTKFLASSNPTDPGNNLNVDNSKVLKAIIGGGLFPNIARIKKVKYIRRGCFVKVLACTEEDGNVQIHPSSVNAQQHSFDSNYLVYHMKQKTSTIFLYDTTMVTPWSLLFFGDMLKTGTENGKSYISVAQLYFECNEATINLIKDLRNGLNLLLQKKLCKPSPICWVGDEGRLLRAIMHLVSIDRKLEFNDDDDDYEVD